jgi:hypothetical protein
MRALNTRSGILGIWAANSATLHGFASLEPAHVVALYAVWAVLLLILVIASTLAGTVDTI